MIASGRSACVVPQDLFHLLSLGQFIDQFVQVPHFPGEGIFYFLYAVSANDSRDEMGIRIQVCATKKVLKADFLLNELGQFVQRLSLAGVDLFPDDTLELHLRNVAGLPAPDPNRPPRVEPEQNTGDATDAGAE